MAEKKKHNLVAASEGSERKYKQAKPVGNSGALRFGAVVCWIIAIACEVLGILALLGKLHITFLPTLWQIIGFLVIDLIFVIIGAQLWKKANHIKPMSKKNKFLFWLWNNMGVIVCIIAFVPYIILLLKDKNLDKKTKAIATVVAVIALLIGSLASYDWNPVSSEELDAAGQYIEGIVYWTPYGKVYHTHEDCHALNRTDSLTYGSVEEAIAANRVRLCFFCAEKDDITEDTGVAIE